MVRYIEVHLCMDKSGNPLSGFILEEDRTGQLNWLADAEFGPTDGYVDIIRWLSAALRGTTALRPS